MGMTILEGSTFCICDEIGDLDGRTSGFFAEDTRFLSRLELRVDGARPLLLSSGTVEYFSAAFYLRNPVADGPRAGLALDRARALRRRRDAGPPRRPERDGRRRFASSSRSRSAPTSRTSSRSRSTTSRSATRCTRGRSRRRPRSRDDGANQLVLEEPATASAKTQVLFSRPGRIDGSRVRFALELAPRERWELRVDVVPSLSGEESLPLVGRAALRRGARARAASRSTPGTCRCRGCARRTTASRARSRSRSPTSRRCGCGRTAASGCSRPPGCRGS